MAITLEERATIRNFRIVRNEGGHEWQIEAAALAIVGRVPREYCNCDPDITFKSK
jgi:hypothetical protein